MELLKERTEESGDFFSQIQEQKEKRVAPIEIKCVGAEKVKVGEYVLYHLQVTVGDKSTLIKKRFSDILRDLHTPVGKPRSVDGPSRHVFESLQGQNMEFIKNRAKEIEAYFLELLKIPGVQTDPVFVNFFQLYNLEDKQMAQKRLSHELEKAKEFAKKQNVPIQFVDAKTAVIVKMESPSQKPEKRSQHNNSSTSPQLSLTSSFKGISFKDDTIGTSPRSPRSNENLRSSSSNVVRPDKSGSNLIPRSERSTSSAPVRTDRSNSNVPVRTDRSPSASNSNVPVRTDRSPSTSNSKVDPHGSFSRKKSFGFPGGVNGSGIF